MKRSTKVRFLISLAAGLWLAAGGVLSAQDAAPSTAPASPPAASPTVTLEEVVAAAKASAPGSEAGPGHAGRGPFAARAGPGDEWSFPRSQGRLLPPGQRSGHDDVLQRIQRRNLVDRGKPAGRADAFRARHQRGGHRLARHRGNGAPGAAELGEPFREPDGLRRLRGRAGRRGGPAGAGCLPHRPGGVRRVAEGRGLPGTPGVLHAPGRPGHGGAPAGDSRPGAGEPRVLPGPAQRRARDIPGGPPGPGHPHAGPARSQERPEHGGGGSQEAFPGHRVAAGPRLPGGGRPRAGSSHPGRNGGAGHGVPEPFRASDP